MPRARGDLAPTAWHVARTHVALNLPQSYAACTAGRLRYLYDSLHVSYSASTPCHAPNERPLPCHLPAVYDSVSKRLASTYIDDYLEVRARKSCRLGNAARWLIVLVLHTHCAVHRGFGPKSIAHKFVYCPTTPPLTPPVLPACRRTGDRLGQPLPLALPAAAASAASARQPPAAARCRTAVQLQPGPPVAGWPCAGEQA